MTDREKLIELISGSGILCEICGENSFQYCAEALTDHLLANSVTFAADTKVGDKWTPTDERLPEETRVPKDVLVYHKLGNCGYVDRAWYDSDKNKWRSALNMNMKVTHWMPLPEPPKEE